MITIKELVKRAHKNAKRKGFWDERRSMGTLLILIISEIIEALEAHRTIGKTQDFKEEDLEWIKNLEDCEFQIEFEKLIKDTFADEIADTFIRLGDLCGGLDIPIELYIKLKMRYNLLRPKMHGKKY